MRDNFKTTTKWLLIHEGGFVDHSDDPGGATNKGVTQRTYDAYRDRNNLPRQSVKHISDNEVWSIYKSQYWDTVMGDRLPSGLDYAVYDFSVNSGPSRSIRFLQELLGVTVDGVMGNITLAVIKNSNDIDRLIHDLCIMRLEWMKTLRTWKTFGRGWTRRVVGEITGAQPGEDTGVIDRAIHLYNGTTELIKEPTQSIPGKAEEKDKKLSQKIKDGMTLENAAKVGTGALPGAAMIPSGPLQWAVAAAIVIVVLVGTVIILRKEEII